MKTIRITGVVKVDWETVLEVENKLQYKAYHEELAEDHPMWDECGYDSLVLFILYLYFEKDISSTEIARYFKKTKCWVTNIVKRCGVKPKDKLYRSTKILSNEVVRFIRANPEMTLKELSIKFNASSSVINTCRKFMTYKNVI